MPAFYIFSYLYGETKEVLYYDAPQLNGKAAHSAIDEKRYSTKKDILQGAEVYCNKYKLCGKIDIYDRDKKLLTERKKKITRIYDGYIFQLYAQYFCLDEMNCDVENLRFYSMDDNKTFPIKLPKDDFDMFAKFEKIIDEINSFEADGFCQNNSAKCERCIYNNLCDRSLV
ncbi:MAG: type V CRISPR-associated protein Cas4 [Helicobacteraceae bacterium]|nr:type V CRISPR-associated protein Cas4 [Helicobacteraceae bacterium]